MPPWLVELLADIEDLAERFWTRTRSHLVGNATTFWRSVALIPRLHISVCLDFCQRPSLVPSVRGGSRMPQHTKHLFPKGRFDSEEGNGSVKSLPEDFWHASEAALGKRLCA